MKFTVGDRVKVVKDEMVSKYVGALGTIDGIYDDDDGFDYSVKFDKRIGGNTKDAFAEDELDFDDDVMVIEGDARILVDESRAFIGNTPISKFLEPFEGDTVRITVEVLRKAGE